MRSHLSLLGVMLLVASSSAARSWAQPPTLEPGAEPRPLLALDQSSTASGVSSADGEYQLLWQPQSSQGRVYVLDPPHHRLIGFGGIDQTAQKATRQVWSLSLTGGGWTQLLAGAPGEVSPGERQGHAMTYDPVRHRVILFGGYLQSPPYGLQNDVWALSMGGTPQWQAVSTTGTPPAPRSGASAVYDPVRDRIVYFGGFDNGAGGDLHSNEIWELSLASNPAVWKLSSAQGPYPSIRAGQFAVYDAPRDRMLMYGSLVDASSDTQVWELDFSPTPAWHVIPSSTPGPSATYYPAMAFDVSRDRLLLFREDHWEFSLSPDPHWTSLGTSGPVPPPADVNTIYDPVGDRVIRAPGPGAYQWSLAGPLSWVPVPGATPTPVERFNHAITVDTQNRMWIFGGMTAAWSYADHDLNDVWMLSLNGAPAWSLLSPSGTPPTPRHLGLLQYDPNKNRLLLFGGCGNSPDAYAVYYDELWELSLTGGPHWTQLTPSGTPPTPRCGASWVYDPVGNRLILYGGYDGERLNDMWELNLESDPPVWSELNVPCPCPQPSDYLQPQMVYDFVRHRVIMYFSYVSVGPDALWELALQPGYAWTPVTTSGPKPEMDSPTLLYDPQRDRIVLLDWLAYYVMALSLGTTPPQWVDLNPTGPTTLRASTHGIFDLHNDRVVFFGSDGSYLNSETWTLNFGSPVDVSPETRAIATSLEPCRPNPASDRVTLGYTLATAAPVRLDVLDVTGRRLATLVDGVVPAGRHEVKWNLRSASGRRIDPGVYLYRLRTPGASAVRRLVTLQ